VFAAHEKDGVRELDEEKENQDKERKEQKSKGRIFEETPIT